MAGLVPAMSLYRLKEHVDAWPKARHDDGRFRRTRKRLIAASNDIHVNDDHVNAKRKKPGSCEPGSVMSARDCRQSPSRGETASSGCVIWGDATTGTDSTTR